MTNGGGSGGGGGGDETYFESSAEEDMAILDQLLELQQNDNAFQASQTETQNEINEVQEELDEQEKLLAKLRQSLLTYHGMKNKYEIMVNEISKLENEKIELAEQVSERASGERRAEPQLTTTTTYPLKSAQLAKNEADPNKGSSAGIKSKLTKVEDNLARARHETKKHQQMYKLAEREAQRCGVLERKIGELKTGKVNLMRRQKVSEKHNTQHTTQHNTGNPLTQHNTTQHNTTQHNTTQHKTTQDTISKHRSYTEKKTREIQGLKKKERKQGKNLSKMEIECKKQKNALDRRTTYCHKLTDKLKQTETHLMRLLSMRKREMDKFNLSNSETNKYSNSNNNNNSRMSVSRRASRRISYIQPPQFFGEQEHITFAPKVSERSELVTN